MIEGPDPELGYNFKHLVPAAAFLKPQQTRVEYVFTRTSDDEPVKFLFEGRVLSAT